MRETQKNWVKCQNRRINLLKYHLQLKTREDLVSASRYGILPGKTQQTRERLFCRVRSRLYPLIMRAGLVQCGITLTNGDFPYMCKCSLTEGASTWFSEPLCVETLQGQASPWYACRWKNIHRYAFIHGWANHARCKLCVYLHVSCCDPCSQRGPILAPVPLCVSYHYGLQQGVPTCLSTRGDKAGKLPGHYIT